MDRLIEDKLNNIEVQIEDEQRCVKYDIREFTIEYYVDKYSKGVKNDINELYVPEYQREFILDRSSSVSVYRKPFVRASCTFDFCSGKSK